MNLNQVHNNGAVKQILHNQLLDVLEHLSVDQTKTLLAKASSLAATANDEVEAVEVLSSRELEVLVLVASGYNRKNIGISLGISANTAARHIANIYTKLGISSVAEATSIAYSNMLIACTRQEFATA